MTLTNGKGGYAMGPKGQGMTILLIVFIVVVVVLCVREWILTRNHRQRADRFEQRARTYHERLKKAKAAAASRSDAELYEAVERTYAVAQACGVSMAELKAVLNNVRESHAEKGSDSIQVSKQQERIRGIVERAQSLLVGALDQMYDVFDGESHTIQYIEAAAAQVRDTLTHFDKDAIAYNEMVAAAAEAEAADNPVAEDNPGLVEDSAVDALSKGGSASFDDKGKRIEDVLARNTNVVEPPEPWSAPRPKHHAECIDGRCHEDCDVARAGEAELPEIKRDKLSDFGEGSDQ